MIYSITIFILPCILVLLAFMGVFTSIKKKQFSLVVGLIASIFTYFIGIIFCLNACGNYGSVGGAFCVIAVPIESLLFSFHAFVIGISLSYLFLILKKRRSDSIIKLLASVVILCAYLIPCYYFVQTKYVINLIGHMNQIELHAAVEKYEKIYYSPFRTFIFSAIVQNIEITPDLLHKISLIKEPSFHERMYSKFGLLRNNPKGISVMEMIAKNRKTTPETLGILSQSQNKRVRLSVLANINTPLGVAYDIRRISTSTFD